MPDQILERDGDLARIAELAQRVDGEARGAALVVEGPAGIGKTRLLAAAREMADECGLVVLTAHGAELERGFAFGLVRQLLDPPLARASEAERADLLHGAAALALPALGDGTAAGGEVDPGGVVHGLYWLVAALAARRPLLLTVDDAHWGDRSSLRFLAHLVRRVESLPVLVAVACRPLAGEPSEPLPALLVADPAVEVMRPQALGAAAVERLLAQRLSSSPEPGFVDACLSATGGNPFLIGELARELKAQGIEPTAGSVERVTTLRPDKVARSLTLRLGRAGAEAAALAGAVAVLGEEAELGLAGELAGLNAEAAADALDALVREGLLLPDLAPRFVHPLLSTAADGALRPGERSRLHAHAAELLGARGASPERMAPHLLETAPRGEGATVDTLIEAARLARARGAPDAATVMLRRALEEPARAELRAGLLWELGIAEFDLGLPSAPDSLAAAHRAADDPILAARAATALASAAGPDVHHHRETLPLLERAVEQLGDRDPELTLALESTRLSALMLVPELADRLGPQARRLAELPGATPTECVVLAWVARALIWAGEPAGDVAPVAERAARRPEALQTEGIGFFWAVNLSIALTALDRVELAERVTEEAVRFAQERGSAHMFSFAVGLRATMRHAAGDLRGAEADARAAEASGDVKAWGGHQILIPLVLTLADQGRTSEAQRLLADWGLDGALPDLDPMTHLLFARGRLRLAAGDAEAALADLREVRTRTTRYGGGDQTELAVASAIALALQAASREEDARRAAGDALARARAWGTNRAIGTALWVGGRLQRSEEGLPMLREATEVLAESQARLWYARALVDYGAALRRAGARADAREPLRQGLELAERRGAAPLAETARVELAASGVRVRRRDRDRDALTPSEQRIAELAAQGATNPEIAQALFVTVKTVEGHLSKAYRKLEVRSRHELQDALSVARGGPESPS